MQNDLISRSALLEKFNDTGTQITFDLPVEEVLGEDVDIEDFAMLVQDAIQAYKKMVIGVIQEQPTAYDVEKVVRQLGCQMERRVNCFPDKIRLDKAIYIVRNGGKE